MKKEKTIRPIHSITLTVIYSAALILSVMALLSSCTAPKFVVTSIEVPDNSTHNVLVTAMPINKPAYKMSNVNEITILTGDNVKVHDTLTITRKYFTNY
jgi:hypothetical protein